MLKPVFEVLKKSSVIGALHVCRGNYTKDISGLLKGSYDQLSDFFSVVKPDMLTLEFSTPRAGSIDALFKNEFIADELMLGLGSVDPKTDDVEDVNFIVSRVEEVLRYLPAENIWLNPDCGFATFETRPMNTEDIVFKKIRSMVEASRLLRIRS